MSKRTPGPKWSMKQNKERYRKERERHRERLANIAKSKQSND